MRYVRLLPLTSLRQNPSNTQPVTRFFSTTPQMVETVAPVVATSTASQAYRIVASFLRRGKKERREGILHAVRRESIAPRSVNSKESTTAGAILRSFSLSATPFVALKQRRWGKRVVVKVAHLPRKQGERKALVALANSLKEEGAASAPFSTRLLRHLEGLSSAPISSTRTTGVGNKPRPTTKNSTKPFSIKPVTSATKGTSGKGSALRERRDTVHYQAMLSLPTT